MKSHHYSLRHISYTSLTVVLALLWLSYQPLVNLGIVSGVHIDISLLYITVGLCILFSLRNLWKNLPVFARQPLWLTLFAFTLISSFSMLWSPNSFRALVTVAFNWVILAFVSTILLHHQKLKKRQETLIKVVAAVGILSAIWAIFQIIGDTADLSRSLTLLPQAYTGGVFGIARPTGFALEPQFFGSLLIAPICWFAWKLLTKKPNALFVAGFLGTFSLLILTLSRGAIIGAVVALLVLLILKRPNLKQSAVLFANMGVSVLVSLGLIFTVASFRQDAIDGQDAVRRSVSHLTLGIINLPTPAKQKSEKTTGRAVVSEKKSDTGYVESSTSSRLSTSQAALKIWSQSASTVLFGVGVGGFGASVTETSDDVANSIVNNYYLEILAELGIVGLGTLLTFFGLLLFSLAKKKQWLLISIIAGFLVQCCFFSGNANILHVWAIAGLALGCLYSPKISKKKPLRPAS
ncbi:MAG TPA: O-antigen ligase family protein [Candidatus Saccharimonadales bacterium]